MATNEEIREKYIKLGFFWNVREGHNKRCMTSDLERAFNNALNEARVDGYKEGFREGQEDVIKELNKAQGIDYNDFSNKVD